MTSWPGHRPSTRPASRSRLGALDGTALGREIHQEITEGTRPPFPLTPSTVLAGTRWFPRAIPVARGGARPARPGGGGSVTWPGSWPAPGCDCPGSGASCGAAAARSSTWTHSKARSGTAAMTASGPSIPSSSPGPPQTPAGRHRVARRGAALRDRGRHPRGVRRPHPGPGESAGPVDLVDGAIASASVPIVFPPHPMADDDYVDGGVIEIVPVSAAAALGATRIIAVVAVPLRLPRDERTTRRPPPATSGSGPWG